MSPPTVADVRNALHGYRGTTVPGARLMPGAAVAAVVRETSNGAELLFIRRAEHPKDPWSGHMGFPGGRVDADDAEPLSAALRETLEEVDLDLTSTAKRIGRLSDVVTIAPGKVLPMVIVPFVFELTTVPTPELTPNEEVQEALWVPLGFFTERRNRSTLRKRFAGIPFDLPAYTWEGRLIWGLTLKMVDELVNRLGITGGAA